MANVKISDEVISDMIKRISKLEEEKEKQHREEITKLRSEIQRLETELEIARLQSKMYKNPLLPVSGEAWRQTSWV